MYIPNVINYKQILSIFSILLSDINLEEKKNFVVKLEISVFRMRRA